MTDLRRRKYILTICFTILAALFVIRNFEPYDFYYFFYPALRELAHFRSPYIPGVYTPAWGLIPFAPLGLLPYQTAKEVFFILMSVGFILPILHCRIPWWGALIYLCSPPVITCLWMGNLDWLVILGAITHPALGIWLALVKPQVGIGLALYYALKGKVTPGYALFVAIIFVLHFVLVPWQDVTATIPIWPWGLVVGVPAFVLALLLEHKLLALAASPFMSPYSLLYSYSGAVLGAVEALGRWSRREKR